MRNECIIIRQKKNGSKETKRRHQKQRLTQFHSWEFHKITKMEAIIYMNRTCGVKSEKKCISQNKIN